jgi:opacity protein-like surface antigen
MLAGALALAGPAGAQDEKPPTAELFGGYSYLKVEDLSLHGWGAEVAGNVLFGGKLGVVLRVDGHYGSEESVDLSDHGYMGGLRFALHRRGLTPFVYGLAGAATSRASLTVFGVSISESSTDFAWAAGGGVNVRLGDHWALGLRGDYYAVSAEDGSEGNPRFAVGVAYRIR